MKPVYYFCFFGILILLKTVVSDDNHPVYDSSYIQSQQTRTITPGQNGWRQYGFIGANSNGCYNPNSYSWITLNASSGYHITIRFMWLSSDCPYDILQITGETGQPTTFCGFNTPSYSIYSSSNWLMLIFSTDPYQPTCLGGFRLYYTSYHHGECWDNEFRCAFDGRCIPEELKCDSYDNCGDWSDERGGTCGLSTGAVIAISVTCALVGISCIAFITYCLYDRAHHRNSTHRRRSSRRNTTEPHPPVEPVGPPTYTESPPDYTYINTVYAGVYEELDHSKDPPAYQSFTTTPYNNNYN